MTLGKLSVVATPIGNLVDISYRAIEVLKAVDYILCEDTRVSGNLLKHYQIKTPTISYHQHSNLKKTEQIINLLKNGKNLALISDAGTPGISDPGGQLLSSIREEFENKIKIDSIPGASALTAALAIAGLGFDRFIFYGFLPHKKGRQKILQSIIKSEYSAVIYESKHRIVKLLQELIALEKKDNIKKEIVIVRELTKLHEQIYLGELAVVLMELQSRPENLKGEFVVLLKSVKVK